MAAVETGGAFADRLVVVTGAASGIGLWTARLFARAGAHLRVCDITSERLSALELTLLREGARSARAFSVDVASREQVADFCIRVSGDGIPDVLVNNAGVGLAGGFAATTLEDWQWLLNVNLLGVIHGCHFFAPKMVSRGRGQIVNIASAAGFYNSDAMVAYGTTKYAVMGLSEGLRAEFGPRGVGVSVVCPGFVDTEIPSRMRLRGEANPEHERGRIEEFYRRRNFAPERVARSVLFAARHNPALLPVTPEAWALYFLTRIAPDTTHRVIARAQGLLERRRRSGKARVARAPDGGNQP